MTDLCAAWPCAGPEDPWANSVFAWAQVLPAVNLGSRIEWEFQPQARLYSPWQAVLELSRAGTSDNADWQRIGSFLTEPAYLLDPLQRDFGVTPEVHYRIVVRDARQRNFVSPVLNSWGQLDFRSWRLLRALIKGEVRRMRTQPAGIPIWLLKRKRRGAPCDHCVDRQTGEVLQPHCHCCFGVGFEGGYYQPTECGWAAPLDGRASQESVDLQGQGSIDQAAIVRVVRMVAAPQLHCRDVVVFATTGERFSVQALKVGAEVRGVPVIYEQVRLQLLPRSDPIYMFSVPAQLEALYA